jgi:hypothetical protein
MRHSIVIILLGLAANGAGCSSTPGGSDGGPALGGAGATAGKNGEGGRGTAGMGGQAGGGGGDRGSGGGSGSDGTGGIGTGGGGAGGIGGECLEGATRSCGVSNVGSCKVGIETCSSGIWVGCAGEVDPKPADTCDAGDDDDCDGIVTNGAIPNTICKCLNGSTETCAQALNDKGSCAAGKTTCVDGNWGPCSVQPATQDTCVAGNDDSCDGIPNNGTVPNAVCTCLGTTTSSCETAFSAKGACAEGSTTCDNGKWGPCSIKPAASDTCESGNDNNCDGVPNEGCACIDGTSKEGCTSSSICSNGYQACTDGVYSSTCTYGAGSTGTLSYCQDEDGDGYCDPTVVTYGGGPAPPLIEQSVCGSPGASWRLCSTCNPGVDCYPQNKLFSNCETLPADDLTVGGFSKGWFFGSCNSVSYEFTCPAGTASRGQCYDVKTSGGGTASITRCDSGASGTVTLSICDSGTTSGAYEAHVYCSILQVYP